MAGLSFDSGPLIRLDRRERDAWTWLKRAVQRGAPPLVCTVAVAEAWRDGRTQAMLAKALSACELVTVDEVLAKAAGSALRSVPNAGVADAIIAAAAAMAGTALLTDDPDDMLALADGHFRSLRVLT